jgi:cytoskeleton protein RodZ
MASLGSYLRELRQRRGVSIDEVSRATRVATQYLQALETDDHAGLPAPVFTRGFVRAYCQFLGEPPDEALSRYNERLAEAVAPAAPGAHSAAPSQPVAPLPASSAPAEREARGRGAVLISFVLLVVLGLALLAVTLVLNTGRDQQADGRTTAPAAAPGAPPGGTVETTAPAPTASTPRPATAAPVPPSVAALPRPLASGDGRPAVSPPADPALAPGGDRPGVTSVPASVLQEFVGSVGSPYRLVARTTEPTWVRVRTADGRLTEETIPAGHTREWVSNSPFELTLGNAGGVTLELNGRRLPLLGGRGVVIPRLVLPPPQQ